MPRTPAPFLLALVLGLVLEDSSRAAQARPPALLGKWHGTSTCIKASWNASCNDEDAYYEFLPGPGGLPQILLHAYKRVGTTIEPMGDLEFLPDTGGARWVAEFKNTRVHVRWFFQVADSGLTGTLLLLPTMRVGRMIRAQRDSTRQPPPS